MTRIYEHRGFWNRQFISLGIIVAVMIYGAWEVWFATTGPAPTGGFGMLFGFGAHDGYIFGILFILGGVYAFWTLLRDSADIVASLDRNEATGETVTTLWRPLGPLKLAAGPDGLTNWRMYVKVGGRNLRIAYIYADHADYPRPLVFDVRRADLTGLRTIAPEAVAEYEAAVAPRT